MEWPTCERRVERGRGAGIEDVEEEGGRKEERRGWRRKERMSERREELTMREKPESREE
jgi:hypothetical protein